MLSNKWFKIIAPAFVLVVLSLTLVLTRPVRSDVQPYYSGDAILYNNRVIVATANTGYLEIFQVTNGQLNRLMKIKSYDSLTHDYNDFSELKLSVENGNLYIYATAKYTLFKYDFSDLQNLSLVTKTSNTYWDWYRSVDTFGDNLGTVGDHGLKILNPALEVIDAFNFTPSDTYSLRASGSRQYLLGFNASTLQVYDRASRTVIKEIPVNFNTSDHGRKIYYDTYSQNIYLVDDFYAKKFSWDGQLLASFKHLEAPGYEMAGLDGDPYVYFSNGLGVVKLNKSDFRMAGYAFTTATGGPQGWAMGLKVLNTSAGDVVIVFNNTNILVLDKNLKKIASVRAEEQANPNPQSSLYLNLNTNIGAPGTTVNLTGGGFWANEGLKVTFADRITNAQADSYGRINLNLTVPPLPSQTNPLTSRVDIKVIGLNSGLTYSIGFTILQ